MTNQLFEEMALKNGQILLSVTGYSGEEDFYAMYAVIQELLQPEEATYGVDSMCVDGSFRKNGLLVRMSSECITDECCFHYDPSSMSEEEAAQVRAWLDAVVTELHARRPK
jgi:hypothetical protein